MQNKGNKCACGRRKSPRRNYAPGCNEFGCEFYELRVLDERLLCERYVKGFREKRLARQAWWAANTPQPVGA